MAAAALWQGNLPCLTGPRDACDAHNPDKKATFYFDDSLSHSHTTAAANPITWLSAEPKAPAPAPDSDCPQIWSSLVRNAETTDPLHAVHSSIPYSLSFYHIHAALTAHRTGGPDASAPILAALTCEGTCVDTDGPSQIKWECTPRIVTVGPGNQATSNSGEPDYCFYHLTHLKFAIHLGRHRNAKVVYASKDRPLVGSWRSFHFCKHMARDFTSIYMQQKNENVNVRIRFTLKNTLSQAFDNDWDSNDDLQPQDVSCGHCLTDVRMRFGLDTEKRNVVIEMWIARDLGNASDETECRWISALRGKTNLSRPKSDSGRMRKEFLGSSHLKVVQKLGKTGAGEDAVIPIPATSSSQVVEALTPSPSYEDSVGDSTDKQPDGDKGKGKQPLS